MNNVIWTRLIEEENFNIEQGIYIGAVYLSPMNQSDGQRIEYNPFDILRQDISNFIIIMGDFNTRMDNMSDLVVGDGCERVTLRNKIFQVMMSFLV